MSSPALRRPWRPLIALATVVCVALLGAPPANAQLPEEYWFGQLSVKKAWTITKGAGVKVAVVGSGVVGTLGDLKGQVLPGADFSGQHTDGRSDHGDECDKLGCYGHGTDMSLIIAGTGNGTGYEGVAPGVKILPVKVSARTGAEAATRSIAKGVRWAVDHGAKIINISEAGFGSCDPDEGSAIKYAYDHDVIVVAGAGNDGIGSVESPANCPGALAVSATNGGPQHGPIPIWAKSNYGPQISFTGIGVDMVQELLSGTKVLHANGTSQATAITSACLALIRARFPKMSAREVVARALWSVHNGAGLRRIGHRINNKIGYGMILPYQALHGDVPADFPNPIYDAWEKKFAASSSTAPGSSPPRSSDGPSAPSGSGAAPSPERRADSGGSGSGVLIGVIVGIVVLALIVVAVLVARRNRSTSPPFPRA